MKVLAGLITVVFVSLLMPSCINDPVACFTTDKAEHNDTVQENLKIEFFSCSTDTETHDWDFGDSTVAKNAGTAIQHIYEHAGKYTVTLKVRNASKTDQTTRLITVIP